MDKLIILGLIGYLIWSNSSDQTTEPAQTQNVNNPVNSNPVNLEQQQESQIVNLVANQLQIEEPQKENAGNVRLTPPDLYSYQQYEDFDRYLTA